MMLQTKFKGGYLSKTTNPMRLNPWSARHWKLAAPCTQIILPYVYAQHSPFSVLGGPKFLIEATSAGIRVDTWSGSTIIAELTANKMYEFYLTDNSTTGGAWAWIMWD